MSSLNALTDEMLIGLVNNGDTNAYNEIHCRYKQRIYYYIYRMLNGEKELSEDVLQEVFLSISEFSKKFNPEKKFVTWIYTITRNKIKNIYRERGSKSFQSIDEKIFNLETGSDRTVDMNDFVRCLKVELESLSEEERSTFWLRHQEGLRIDEISEILGSPEGTIHSRLHNIAKKMALRLSEYKVLLEEDGNGM